MAPIKELSIETMERNVKLVHQRNSLCIVASHLWLTFGANVKKWGA